MRRCLVVLLVGAVIVSGYLFARHSRSAVKAFNSTNLFPYEAAAGLRLEPKV